MTLCNFMYKMSSWLLFARPSSRKGPWVIYYWIIHKDPRWGAQTYVIEEMLDSLVDTRSVLAFGSQTFALHLRSSCTPPSTLSTSVFPVPRHTTLSLLCPHSPRCLTIPFRLILLAPDFHLFNLRVLECAFSSKHHDLWKMCLISGLQRTNNNKRSVYI